MNRVCLIGRLTRDPESRTTTTGKSVATFSLAVDRRFKADDGPDADFFNIVAWGNSADFVTKYLGRGRLVAVEGRLQQRKYTTQEGHERQVIEVVADNVQGLDRAPETQNSQATTQSVEDDYDPFA